MTKKTDFCLPVFIRRAIDVNSDSSDNFILFIQQEQLIVAVL
jgi:hypothetical protein